MAGLTRQAAFRPTLWLQRHYSFRNRCDSCANKGRIRPQLECQSWTPRLASEVRCDGRRKAVGVPNATADFVLGGPVAA